MVAWPWGLPFACLSRGRSRVVTTRSPSTGGGTQKPLMPSPTLGGYVGRQPLPRIGTAIGQLGSPRERVPPTQPT